MLPEPTRVFVYGTLKPGESNYDSYCAAAVVQAQPGIALGQLLALPQGYPAMVEGDRPVQGVLLEFGNAGVLTVLDALEDYDADRPTSQNEYQRRAIKIYGPDQSEISLAWTYVMAIERAQAMGGVVLPDGIWNRHVHRRLFGADPIPCG